MSVPKIRQHYEVFAYMIDMLPLEFKLWGHFSCPTPFPGPRGKQFPQLDNNRNAYT